MKKGISIILSILSIIVIFIHFFYNIVHEYLIIELLFIVFMVFLILYNIKLMSGAKKVIYKVIYLTINTVLFLLLVYIFITTVLTLFFGGKGYKVDEYVINNREKLISTAYETTTNNGTTSLYYEKNTF